MPHKKSRPKLPHLSYSGPYDKAVSIANFYGFSLIRPPQISKEDREYAEKLGDTDKAKIPSIADRIALIRHYDKEGWEALPHPICVVYTRKNGSRDTRKLFINILGTEKSIADMLVIHLSWIILSECTKKTYDFSVNTIGDKESSAQFSRELSQYFRKHINALPDDCREEFKQDLSKILEAPREECLEFQQNAPRSLNFLSEYSRKHFKEILEYLEATELPYSIDESLLPPKDAFSETIFALKPQQNTTSRKTNSYACGARSNTLTRGAGLRRTVSLVSSTIQYSTTGRETIKEEKHRARPLVHLMHLGDEARLRLFELLEKLRKAKIPVSVSFGKERMSDQMTQAERLHVKKTLIVGQKEALEHSVIVRDMETHSQEIVDIDRVARAIK